MALLPRADLVNVTRPYIWPPSSVFDGIDGKWSSWTLNVGDDGAGRGQDFRVLISTSDSATFVPGMDSICADSSDVNGCYQSRGLTLQNGVQSRGFNPDSSAGWRANNNFKIDPDITGYFNNVTASIGTDYVGLGTSSADSLILANRPLGIVNSLDMFVGLFGLSNLPVIYPNEEQVTSFLTEFNSSAQIPSLSYGYTAGCNAASGGKQITGSLTLGGYDSARRESEKVIVGFPGGGGENTSLVVGVSTMIIESNGGSVQAIVNNGEGFLATIDSALPYFWFPDEVVDSLEQAYNLTFDRDADLYTLSSTQRAQNDKKTMTITLGNTVNDPDAIPINVPFTSLDLEAIPPFVKNATRYFPLKRSTNGRFVLGRAFLQHAYLAVDYERRNFTVAQAVLTEPLPEPKIETIYRPGTEPWLFANENSGGSNKLSGGAIAGIVIGALAGVGLIAAAIWFFLRRRKSKQEPIPNEKANGGYYNPPEHPGSPPPQYPVDKPQNVRRVSELDDSSRATSAQGYYPTYGHRSSESGSNMTELMGSPPLGHDEKAYFKFASPETEPAPLAELPGDHGLSELAIGGRRPRNRRNRSSSSGGSGGRIQSPEGERPDPIQEDEEHSPVDRRNITSNPTVIEPDEILPASRIESPDPEEYTRGTTTTAGHSETTTRTETTATSITRSSSQSETTEVKSKTGQGLFS